MTTPTWGSEFYLVLAFGASLIYCCNNLAFIPNHMKRIMLLRNYALPSCQPTHFLGIHLFVMAQMSKGSSIEHGIKERKEQ